MAWRFAEKVIWTVKRNPEKYNAALMKEKVAFFSRKEKRLNRYRKVSRCLSLGDMQPRFFSQFLGNVMTQILQP